MSRQHPSIDGYHLTRALTHVAGYWMYTASRYFVTVQSHFYPPWDEQAGGWDRADRCVLYTHHRERFDSSPISLQSIRYSCISLLYFIYRKILKYKSISIHTKSNLLTFITPLFQILRKLKEQIKFLSQKIAYISMF